MTAAATLQSTSPRDCIVDALAKRSWSIHVLFLAWGWLAADHTKPEEVRGPWAREPFEELVGLLAGNGFASVDRLRAAIADDDTDAALALAQSAFASTSSSEIDAALRKHPAALDLAYGRAIDAPSAFH